MPILSKEDRQYQRYIHTEKEQDVLESKGFESVYSSNVSAIARDKADLIIRFHGGATYGYTGKGKLYERMMAAASKGKWVWRFLIRPRVPYYKAGSVVIPNDIESTDMMEEPRQRKYDVDTIIPLDELGNKMLPQIRIIPIDRIPIETMSKLPPVPQVNVLSSLVINPFLPTMANGKDINGLLASLILVGNVT
jgi:hypothetical protein